MWLGFSAEVYETGLRVFGDPAVFGAVSFVGDHREVAEDLAEGSYFNFVVGEFFADVGLVADVRHSFELLHVFFGALFEVLVDEGVVAGPSHAGGTEVVGVSSALFDHRHLIGAVKEGKDVADDEGVEVHGDDGTRKEVRSKQFYFGPPPPPLMDEGDCGYGGDWCVAETDEVVFEARVSVDRIA